MGEKEEGMRKEEALALVKKMLDERKDPMEILESIETIEGGSIEEKKPENCPDAITWNKEVWSEYLSGRTRMCAQLWFCDGSTTRVCTSWQPYKP